LYADKLHTWCSRSLTKQDRLDTIGSTADVVNADGCSSDMQVKRNRIINRVMLVGNRHVMIGHQQMEAISTTK
jgi:uncharacterized tellurite resistance protein B-like protein